MNLIGLNNKIRWLQRAVQDGDHYSQFLLTHLLNIRKEHYGRAI